MCKICLQTPCDPRCPGASDEAVLHCDMCDGSIYEDEEYYSIGGEYLCEECVESCKKTAEREYD